MARARLAAVLLLALALACKPGPKSQLRRMGYAYATEGLLQAARDGNLAAVKLFISAEFDVNARDGSGVSALLLAASEGRTDVVRALLAARADPEAATGDGETAIMFAAHLGDQAMTQALLDAGANPNRRRGDGLTPLLLAADDGKTTLTRALLRAGASVDAADNHGNTPLIKASFAGCEETVRRLLASGADPNLRTRTKETTALGLASAEGHLGIVKLLLASGADPNAREAEAGLTPLAVAAFKGRAGVVQELIGAGAKVDEADKKGSTPLMHAADSGSVASLRSLLAAGANPNRVGDGDVTPLMIASAKGEIEMVRALLKAGADPRARTEKGYMAIHAAKEEEHEEIARLLEASRGAAPAIPKLSWPKFASAERSFRAPGDWLVFDPMTSETPFRPELSAFGESLPDDGAARALLKSKSAPPTQALLAFADAQAFRREIEPRLAELDASPPGSLRRIQARTADGIAVDGRVVRLPRAGAPESQVAWLVAVADQGKRRLLIDAGGPAASFDEDGVLALIQSIRLTAAPKPPPGGKLKPSPNPPYKTRLKPGGSAPEKR